jgi:hypothetical protein
LEIANRRALSTSFSKLFSLCGTTTTIHSNDDLKMQKYQKWFVQNRGRWRESDNKMHIDASTSIEAIIFLSAIEKRCSACLLKRVSLVYAWIFTFFAARFDGVCRYL